MRRHLARFTILLAALALAVADGVKWSLGQ